MTDNVTFVSFKVMKDLTSLRHFTEQTIRDCIAQILHQYKRTLTDVEKQQVFDAVVSALDCSGWRATQAGKSLGHVAKPVP